jgi:hypothetical protein
MEILEIHTSTDMRVPAAATRPAGAYTYHINCRQFSTVHRAWQLDHQAQVNPLAVMTLEFQCIWMTPAETAQVAAAIKDLVPQIVLTQNPPAALASPPGH